MLSCPCGEKFRSSTEEKYDQNKKTPQTKFQILNNLIFLVDCTLHTYVHCFRRTLQYGVRHSCHFAIVPLDFEILLAEYSTILSLFTGNWLLATRHFNYATQKSSYATQLKRVILLLKSWISPLKSPIMSLPCITTNSTFKSSPITSLWRQLLITSIISYVGKIVVHNQWKTLKSHLFQDNLRNLKKILKKMKIFFRALILQDLILKLPHLATSTAEEQ